MSRTVLLALVAASVSCGSEPGPNGDPADVPRVVFNLDNAPLPHVARLLGQLTGRGIVIAPEVDRVSECLTISILNPAPVPVSQALVQTREAYADSGVQVVDAEGSLVFRRAEGATLPSCAPALADGLLDEMLDDMREEVAELERGEDERERDDPLAVVRASLRTISADEVEVSRAALHEVLGNQEALMRAARVVPHQQDGVASLKIFGIRSGSLLGLLGFRNGDGIRLINGHDVASPQAALEAYAQVRNADDIRVELIRNGQPMTRTIHIAD